MASMRKGSIAARLFLLSAVWLIVALAGTAFLLTELYSRSLDAGLTNTLEFQLEALVGRTFEIGNPMSDEVDIQDPRFSRPRSGWYWAIYDENGALLNVSSSLVGIQLPQISGPYNANNSRSAVERDGFGTQLRMIERQVSLQGRELHIVVTGNLDEVLAQAGSFRGQALIVLGAVGAMLAVMSAIGARIALRAVGRLRAAVESVREGESDRVTGAFPYEIAPLAEEVNALLRSNTGIIERSRSQVGNLAHGLKTPIAVIRNEAAGKDSPLARVVTTEVDKMMQIVSTYLDQARLAARVKVVGQKSDPTALVNRLVRAMAKIHPDKTVTLSPLPPSLPWFRGEGSDFEEMVGNLLDNACKWARSEVIISLADDTWAGSRALVVRVEDDGKGLTEEEAKAVLKRGVRLDEKTPGSGLGLDIVKELVDVYGGGFVLGRAQLGGLRAELLLPAARPGTRPARP